MQDIKIKDQIPHCSKHVLADVPFVQVINSDCIDVLKSFADNEFDLAICDPPYGIGFDKYVYSNGDGAKAKGFKKQNNKVAPKNWDKGIPSKEYFYELFRVSKNQIIWGGNYFTEFLPPKMGWIYWHKKGNDASNFSDGELAWTSFDRALKFVKYDWIGFGYINNAGDDKKIHPTMKPKELYEWVLENYAKKGDKILDTHLGSGSSAIASFRLGFDFVGIEIDKDYYQSSIKRFNEQTAQVRLF